MGEGRYFLTSKVGWSFQIDHLPSSGAIIGSRLRNVPTLLIVVPSVFLGPLGQIQG